MPPAELSMSTVACSDRIFSACWVSDSISSCWVEGRSLALEYCSSTGRVREKSPQPVAGSTSNSVRAWSSGVRRIKMYDDLLVTFEYTAPNKDAKPDSDQTVPASGPMEADHRCLSSTEGHVDTRAALRPAIFIGPQPHGHNTGPNREVFLREHCG